MLKISDLTGLWTRSLQVWADGRRDSTTDVTWLQGRSIYADLRQPVGIAGQFQHAGCLNELCLADCETLAAQQGFAGIFFAGDEFFEWKRYIDYQPASGKIDAGMLSWQNDILVELGLQHEHFEHWHRDASRSMLPCWGLILTGVADGVWGNLLRVGDVFMYTRGRLITLTQGSLLDAVRSSGDIQKARELVDCEISFGNISDDNWKITRSTLPYRQGATFNFENAADKTLITQDITTNGHLMNRVWRIAMHEGDLHK